MTLITCARPSLPRAHSPSFLTTRHARSNTRSTSIFMPSVISWNAASQSSNSSDASRPASKKPPEITWPSSPSLPLSYGYGKCPHHLVGPGFAAPERKIVGIGGLPASRLLRLDHLVGNALALAISDRVFPVVEAKGELLLHVAGRGPAHQRLDRSRLLGLVIELPFP